MARFEFKLPDIGEGVAEGEIVAWLVKPGDIVRDDQPMVEVMTDKATVTIAAPRAGRVLATTGVAGDVVKVHAVLAVFDVDGGADETANGTSGPTRGAPSRPADRRSNEHVATAVGDLREDLPGMASATRSRGGPAPAAEKPIVAVARQPDPSASSVEEGFSNKPLATPATRQLARELGVDLRRVRPTGEGGRVTSEDVRTAHSRPQGVAAAGVGAAAAPPDRAVDTARSEASLSRKSPAVGTERRQPLRGIRKRIFETMARSTHTLAHFTFVEECDVTELKRLRERLKPIAADAGVNLSYLPFIVKAVVAALKKHPALNATFDESTSEIVEKGDYNIGIATATDSGLVVPVVRHADQLSLLAIAREIERVTADARAGKSRLPDLQGGTFTITSLGQQGGLLATPIIHFPEAAILGVHQIKRRPVVRGEQIVIGDVMLLSLSFDHRLIDGHVGAAFAYEIIRYLERPETPLLEAV